MATSDVRNKKIFIVDDHEENCRLLSDLLSSRYRTYSTTDSSLALELIEAARPDLIILDYQMPGMMGLDLCQKLRSLEITKETPIIFLSGQATVDERVRAFQHGADDFVSKPFHVQEFLMRIQVRLAGRRTKEETELASGNLVLNLLSHQVHIGAEEVELTPKQFQILKMLLAAKSNLVTREQFIQEIWGDTSVTQRNVDAQINYLKRNIEKYNGRIVAVPSLGYRMIDPV